MKPIALRKKLPVKKGVIFDVAQKQAEKRVEQKSLDADFVQKKKGTSEIINPSTASSPERF